MFRIIFVFAFSLSLLWGPIEEVGNSNIGITALPQNNNYTMRNTGNSSREINNLDSKFKVSFNTLEMIECSMKNLYEYYASRNSLNLIIDTDNFNAYKINSIKFEDLELSYQQIEALDKHTIEIPNIPLKEARQISTEKSKNIIIHTKDTKVFNTTSVFYDNSYNESFLTMNENGKKCEKFQEDEKERSKPINKVKNFFNN